jgi:hypothetical protein
VSRARVSMEVGFAAVCRSSSPPAHVCPPPIPPRARTPPLPPPPPQSTAPSPACRDRSSSSSASKSTCARSGGASARPGFPPRAALRARAPPALSLREAFLKKHKSTRPTPPPNPTPSPNPNNNNNNNNNNHNNHNKPPKKAQVRRDRRGAPRGRHPPPRPSARGGRLARRGPGVRGHLRHRQPQDHPRVHGGGAQDPCVEGHARPGVQRFGAADRRRARGAGGSVPRHLGRVDQPVRAHLSRRNDPDGHLDDRRDELDRARAEDPAVLGGG